MSPSARGLAMILAIITLPACGAGGGDAPSFTMFPQERWLVMVYMAADNDLDRMAAIDINRMEAASSSSYVSTVVQVDTQSNAIGGSTTAKRIKIQADTNPYVITSPVSQDLGEINSATSVAIQDFVVWAKGQYAADRYALILWDHGNSWKGFGVDDTSPGTGTLMGLSELDTALHSARTTAGIEKFDLIGFDACLMAAAELDQLLAAHAVYRVASCEIQRGGWNYDGFLSALAADPTMGASGLARVICDTYIEERVNLQRVDSTQTISAGSLRWAPYLAGAIDSLARALEANLASQFVNIQLARREAKEYLLNEKPNHGGYYLDLDDFARLLGAKSSNVAIDSAVDTLRTTISLAIHYKSSGEFAENHGGVSIYFPASSFDSQLSRYAGTPLAVSTRWNEFLSAFYALQNADVTPPGVTISGPPSGSYVTSASPVTVQFSLSGLDIYDVSAVVLKPLSGTQFLVLWERDWGKLNPGNWTVPWNARAYVVWDGANTYAEWLGAMSSSAGSTFYRARVRHTRPGGTPQDIWMDLDLPNSEPNGYALGFYSTSASGGVASVAVNPGDSLRMLRAVYDTQTGEYAYSPSSVAFTMPAAGLTGLRIYPVDLPSGSYLYTIHADDYAFNVGLAALYLNVP